MRTVRAIAALLVIGATHAAGQAPSAPSAPAAGSSTHTITVKFNYDFRKTPACTAKIRNRCIYQFVVYDISAGQAKRSKLFAIPAPPDAKGPVDGITGTSPKLSLESGKHLLAVVAQYPDGTESRARASTTWITIP